MPIINKTTDKSSSSTHTATIALTKLKDVKSVSVNTGTATYKLDGDNIIVTATGGTYVDYSTGGSFKAPESKTVTEWYALSSPPSTMSYSSGGFSGTISRDAAKDKYDSYVITPAQTKTYTTTLNMTGVADGGPSSKSYTDAEGYSGTIYKGSGSNVSVVDKPADTKTVSVTYSYQFGETGVGQQSNYDKDGYSGVISRSDWYYMIAGSSTHYDGNTYESTIKSIADGKTITKYVVYSGKVTKPATYKQEYMVTYSGTLTKPAVTGTSQLAAYTGVVTDPGYDTRYTTYYYQYDITVDYTQKGAPVGTPIPDVEMKQKVTKEYLLSTYFTEPDGDNMTFSVTSSNESAVRATVTDGKLLLEALSLGESMIILRALDDDENEATISFRASVNNTAPTIQLTTVKPMGTYKLAPTFGFIVADSDNDLLRVRTMANKITLSNKENVSSKTSFVYEMTEAEWRSLPIGTLTLTAEVTDIAGEVATLSYEVKKEATGIDIELKEPRPASVKPTRVQFSFQGHVPVKEDITILATNNAYDPAPTWEDITSFVRLGLIAPFQNEAKVDARWGVSFRVIVTPSTNELVYIDAINASFE